MFLGPQKKPRRGNFRNEIFQRFMTPNFTKPIFHQTSVGGCAASCVLALERAAGGRGGGMFGSTGGAPPWWLLLLQRKEYQVLYSTS